MSITCLFIATHRILGHDPLIQDHKSDLHPMQMGYYPHKWLDRCQHNHHYYSGHQRMLTRWNFHVFDQNG